MSYTLHKISLSEYSGPFKDYSFRQTEEIGIYEILFENCTSTINIRSFIADQNQPIEAHSFWGESGDRIRDTVHVRTEIESPKFPSSEGYRTFEISWDSDGERSNGYIVLKKL